MDKQKLGDWLQSSSTKSNQDLAESIREVKKISNAHDNVVIYQEKRSVCANADKLQKIIKAFNKDAELIIKVKGKTWKQD
jgi:hypothetical protein|tara:strand:- start:211 stop:450 length:240 start_codon:yes stop_codon:yes gene_type:complete